MISKKAMTREQIVKLVFGVLCLLIIILVIVKVYQYGKGKSNLEKAKGTLEELKATLNAAKLYGEAEMIVLTPDEWRFSAWPRQNRPEKPGKDCDKNCICLCEVILQSGVDELGECNKKGVCIELEENKEKVRVGVDAPIIGWRDTHIQIVNPPMTLKVKYKQNKDTLEWEFLVYK